MWYRQEAGVLDVTTYARKMAATTKEGFMETPMSLRVYPSQQFRQNPFIVCTKRTYGSQGINGMLPHCTSVSSRLSKPLL